MQPAIARAASGDADVPRDEPALLAPGQAFFLRENLKLRLLNARLALLTRDFAAENKNPIAWKPYATISAGSGMPARFMTNARQR